MFGYGSRRPSKSRTFVLRKSAPVIVPEDLMSEKIEKSLLDIDFAALTARTYTSSPAAWEDQVLYFLLVDRFSDGNERGGHRDNNGSPVSSGATPLYRANETKRVD